MSQPEPQSVACTHSHASRALRSGEAINQIVDVDKLRRLEAYMACVLTILHARSCLNLTFTMQEGRFSTDCRGG